MSQPMMIYVNTKHIQMNQEDKTNRPVISVDDGVNVVEAFGVSIGENTKVVYNPEGHPERGIRVWIETTEKVEYES